MNYFDIQNIVVECKICLGFLTKVRLNIWTYVQKVLEIKNKIRSKNEFTMLNNMFMIMYI